jgi:hypothetical protein
MGISPDRRQHKFLHFRLEFHTPRQTISLASHAPVRHTISFSIGSLTIEYHAAKKVAHTKSVPEGL